MADHDPLQVCLDAIAGTFVHDRRLARRLPALVRGGGFEDARLRGPSLVETDEAGYMLGIVDRAIDASRASGRFGDDMAAALRSETRGRVEAGTFFGHLAYVSLVARKPA